MNSRLILVLGLIALVVLFIIQNVVVVEIRFLFWSVAMSRALFMFLLLTVGIIIGWSLHGYVHHKQSKRVRPD